MSKNWKRFEDFLFPVASDSWLGILRFGLGIHLVLYSLSLRVDWNSLFATNGNGPIARDLAEAISIEDSPLVPRIGWFVAVGNCFGLSEEKIISAIWICIFCVRCCLVIGLF